MCLKISVTRSQKILKICQLAPGAGSTLESAVATASWRGARVRWRGARCDLVWRFLWKISFLGGQSDLDLFYFKIDLLLIFRHVFFYK